MFSRTILSTIPLFLFISVTACFGDDEQLPDSSTLIKNAVAYSKHSKTVIKKYDTIKMLLNQTNGIVKEINKVNESKYQFYAAHDNGKYFTCIYTTPDEPVVQKKGYYVISGDDQIQLFVYKKSLKIFRILWGG